MQFLIADVTYTALSDKNVKDEPTSNPDKRKMEQQRTKIKHLTGQYLLSERLTSDDIVYFMQSKGKRKTRTDDLRQTLAGSTVRAADFDSCLDELQNSGTITIEQDTITLV